MCPCHQPEEIFAGTIWPFALWILSESHLRRRWWKHAAPIVERSWERSKVVPKVDMLRLDFRKDNELIGKWVDSMVGCRGIMFPIGDFDSAWNARLKDKFDAVLRIWFLYDTENVSGWLDSSHFFLDDFCWLPMYIAEWLLNDHLYSPTISETSVCRHTNISDNILAHLLTSSFSYFWYTNCSGAP